MKRSLKINDEIKNSVIKYIAAFLAVIVIGSMLILLQGENPFNAFREIYKGALGTKISFGSSLRYAMPCILVGIAASIAFKAGIFNMGVEGQLYFGALVAAVVGYSYKFPPIIHIFLCLLAAGLAGLMYAFFPAILKLFFNVSELITTLMLNFMAKLLTEYITMWWIGHGVSNLGSNAIATPKIYDSAVLPNLIKGTSASYGIIIAVLIALVVAIFYKYTIKGYELKQVGENLKFAKIGGVNAKSSFVSIFLLSGFIAGISGGVEVLGSYFRFTAQFASNMGWDGIMIAFIANKNPIAIVLVSFLWGALKAGSLNMERLTSLNKLTVNILLMLFVLFVSVDYKVLFKEIQSIFKKGSVGG
ncbi:MAG TPA: ABC transporter permease [Anaerolineaceae bacterium]|jgi:ABC-type uncharacterized transport system permease subunit|nr:ABC transporter permease [Anaerolineaceae bacterium]